jgi:hypothetical protein
MKITEKEGEHDMNTTVARAGQDIKDLAAVLACFPFPDKWTQEQKAHAVNFAALLETAQKMITAKNVSGIDYEAEKTTFLANAGKTNSAHTRIGYRAALGRLDIWTACQGINPLELTPAQADDFVYALKADGRAPPLSV